MRALLIVDMLEDFVRPDGALPVPGAQDIIDNIGKLRTWAHKSGVPVIYANDAHDEDDLEFKSWPRHCVAGTPGARVIRELEPATDIIVEKKDLSVFTADGFAGLLKGRGIDTLIVTGVATEYCVRAACLETTSKFGRKVKAAATRGMKVILVVDAIAGVDVKRGDQHRALLEMGAAGVTPRYAEEIVHGSD